MTNEEIRKVVFSEKQSNRSVFQSFNDGKVIGKKILDDLRKKRMAKDGYDFPMFISDDREERQGFLSNLYGIVGMLSLQSRLNVALTGDDKEYIKKVSIYLLDYIQENGYCLDPYVDEKINKQLFGPNYPYIGAMTWSLSFLTSVYNAVCVDELFELPAGYLERIKDEIAYIVHTFAENSAVITTKENDPFGTGTGFVGWGFVRGCKRPSLFFSYSVLEAYSDFEDSILLKLNPDENGSLPAGADKAKDLLDYINEQYPPEDGETDEDGKEKTLVEIWRDKCFQLTANVWKVYKDKIRAGFVDDNFLTNVSMVDEDDIRKSNSSNALFNTLYIVFILIYGYANDAKTNRFVEGVSPEEVLLVMNTALRNVQRTYEQFKSNGKDYLIDTYRVPFKIEHEQYKFDYIKLLNTEMLIDTSILPMLVKANNMIAYYIVQYPLKEMSQLFMEIFNLLDQENNHYWLWDINRYDVKITERYIEAIADFYDYYYRYETPCIKGFAEQESVQERIAKKVEKNLRESIEEENKARHERELEEKRRETEQQFSVENLLRETTKQWTQSMITEKLDAMAKRNTDSVNGINSEWDESNESLYAAFKATMFSFLKKAIYETRMTSQKSEEDKKKLQDVLTVIETLSDEALNIEK